MEKPHILHVFTPAAQASPFDVNMAYDAGFDAVVPYAGMGVSEVKTLTQDAIFSRGPKGVRRTGIFIGGRNLDLALEMFDAAKQSMVPPFEVSVFVDPSGAFTTAAATVACVERWLRQAFNSSFAGKRVLVLGGTGPVGIGCAVLAAQEGARVQLASHRDLARAEQAVRLIRERYQLTVEPVLANAQNLFDYVGAAEVIVSAVQTGVEALSADALSKAGKLQVAADVNAVPPPGIAGVGVMDDGAPLKGAASSNARAIGALAIGNVKYQVERGLFEAMLAADKPLYLDFRSAFVKAREVVQAANK
jgi:methylene-tetrahydromethanopterin dehydrogenase